MINLYYFYTFVTVFLLILYELKWSYLCGDLVPELRAFFCFSILLNLLFGYISKKRFAYSIEFVESRNNIFDNTKFFTFFIVLANFCEYAYCGMIPLIATFQGNSRAYTDFTGIPTFHPLLVAFSIFYAQYVFLKWLKKRATEHVLSFLVILGMFVLLLSRAGLMIIIFISLFTAFVFFRLQKTITLKKKICIILFLLVSISIFGSLGNLRTQQNWDDYSFIKRIGQFNDNYPCFMPNSFMWSYIYFAQAIFNFNYNVKLENCSENFFDLYKAILPDYIGKRIWGKSYKGNIKLVNNIFNTIHGWGAAYIACGMFGCVFVLLFIDILILYFLLVSPKCLWSFMILINLNVLVVLFNFTNVLTYSGLSFQLIFPILMILTSKVSFLKLFGRKVKYCE